MTKREFRIQLAKDVIGHIQAKKMVAEELIYCRIPGFTYQSDYEDVQVAMQKAEDCNVWALGSLVVAYAIREDATTVEQARSRGAISERLAPYFGERQLSRIEGAFEGLRKRAADMGDPPGGAWINVYLEEEMRTDPQPVLVALKKFHDRYQDAESRLLAIMRNIVRNGEFKVPGVKINKGKGK